MSHVDEGLIHAYIDGAFPPGNEQGEEIEAHVALCVDCRVRLEKARELKERAQVVMHRLAPETIVTPPFEEVLARRDRARTGGAVPADAGGHATRPPNRRRTDIFPIPFAWAATVILAVGAGWMGRELVLNRQIAGADGASSVIEADAAPPAPDGAPLRSEAFGAPTAPPPPAAIAQDAADTRGQPEERQDSRREAAAGLAPPVATLKAADSPAQQVAALEAGVDSAPIVLRGIDASVSPAPVARRALGATVSTVTAESESRLVTDLSVVAVYVRASAEGRWTPEPYAAAGLIGYEPIARLEGGEPVRSERAVVDSVELLRTVYVIEGDTVEMVQELEQRAIALDAVVVTGVAGADSAGMRRDTARAEAERARALNLPPPAARADDPRAAAAAAREADRIANALDTASVFESKSVVTLRRDERVVLLLGRVPEEMLQALAARIR